MTEFEINFDLILLYLNLLGLHVVIIIENINPSQKIPAVDMYAVKSSLKHGHKPVLRSL